ncbi:MULTISPECIES: SDR family oxidoreductase [Sinorhizobium]|uniref:SDR family oxidoreductase n=1 Tax=Sinorhizobium TaxID=28105 RepID=UPI0004AEA1CA|nr:MULTISPECIES: SDR family oxidoreductase [Sinorhizobium]ASY61285.1 Short-chain dehydrogenase/reductase SDR [Sinorhizobium sp. CCBAU 05631]ASY74260.1 Short-chain dehydrogenase/reductase SDR [Sinorhizobium fredii CCBAU 83666]
MNRYEVALVTGASSGIGKAIALELASAGLRVLALGRDRAALDELHSTAGIVPVVCDLSDVSEVYGKIAGEKIDVLVNNAGLLTASASLVDLSEDDIDAMIDINIRSVFKLTRHVLKQMIERRRGHIFFTGSSGGLAPSSQLFRLRRDEGGRQPVFICTALRSDRSTDQGDGACSRPR